MKRPEILHAIRTVMHQRYPDVQVYLYGSEARGEARSESDIDLLLLVNKDTIPMQEELALTSPLYDIELETGVVINPVVMPRKQWGRLATPFYVNVMKEKVAL